MTNHEPDSSFAGFADLDFNYDFKAYEDSKEGWHHDEYVMELPLASPAQRQRAFTNAKDILRFYKFPDPKRVVGHFDKTAELLGRDMQLRITFLGIRVDFPVRITKVIDKQEGRTERWGFAYRTLQGHWEKGEMTFLVEHDHPNSMIRFRIVAYSQPDKIENFFFRIGFKLIGRYQQKKFAKTCLRRMKELAVADLKPQ